MIELSKEVCLLDHGPIDMESPYGLPYSMKNVRIGGVPTLVRPPLAVSG